MTPTAFELEDHSHGILTTGTGWMVRHPRGGDETQWLLDLAAGATSDDWHLLHVRARDELAKLFPTPEDALAALQTALADQVRCGQVWQETRTGRRVEVVSVDHFGSGPDGTVFVEPLDGDKGWSPGDFRRFFEKLADSREEL